MLLRRAAEKQPLPVAAFAFSGDSAVLLEAFTESGIHLSHFLCLTLQPCCSSGGASSIMSSHKAANMSPFLLVIDQIRFPR
jgi:hypothetical protein